MNHNFKKSISLVRGLCPEVDDYWLMIMTMIISLKNQKNQAHIRVIQVRKGYKIRIPILQHPEEVYK